MDDPLWRYISLVKLLFLRQQQFLCSGLQSVLCYGIKGILRYGAKGLFVSLLKINAWSGYPENGSRCVMKNFPQRHLPKELAQKMVTSRSHHRSEDSWMIVKFLMLLFMHTHIAQACTITASMSSPPYFGQGIVLHCISTRLTPVGPVVSKKDSEEIYRQKDGGKFRWYNATDQSRRSNIC